MSNIGYVEIYNEDEFLKIFDMAYQKTEEDCECYPNCVGCPYEFGEGLCMGSIFGELWRREMNKRGDKNEN